MRDTIRTDETVLVILSFSGRILQNMFICSLPQDHNTEVRIETSASSVKRQKGTSRQRSGKAQLEKDSHSKSRGGKKPK